MIPAGGAPDCAAAEHPGPAAGAGPPGARGGGGEWDRTLSKVVKGNKDHVINKNLYNKQTNN